MSGRHTGLRTRSEAEIRQARARPRAGRPPPPGGPPVPRANLGVVAGVLALALLLALSPAVSAASSSGPAWVVSTIPSHGASVPLADDVANVTWNGVGVDRASSAGGAFAIGPGATASVVFNFTEAPGSPAVTNASLVLIYLGVTLSTESIGATVAAGAGTAQLNWTFGSLLYLTEGVYEVDADLLDANGSIVFHEPFYVDAKAPFVIGSAVAFFALVLGAVEVYWIVTTVRARTARRGRYRFH